MANGTTLKLGRGTAFAAARKALEVYRIRAGDFVFDLAGRWDALETFRVGNRDGEVLVVKGSGEAQPLKSLGRPAPMMLANVTMVPRLPALDGPFRAVFRALAKVLYEAKLKPEAAMTKTTAATGAPTSFVEYVTRAAAASGLVKVTGRDPLLELGELLKRQMDHSRYAWSLGGDLAHSFGRLQYLISHAPTIGGHHETLFRSLLARHLPERYHVATGFVVGAFMDRRPQIDVIVYDRLNYVPLFREGDLVVVDLRAVRGLIEVKSSLTKARLLEGLGLLHEATFREIHDPPFFKGLFAFSGLSDPKKLAEHARDFYATERERNRGHMHFFAPVDAIGVQGRTCLFTTPWPERSQTLLHSVSAQEPDSDEPTAHFLWTLFGFLDVPAESKRAAQHGFMAQMAPAQEHGTLNRGRWAPSMSTRAIPGEPAALTEYVNRVQRWRAGIPE